MKSNLLILKTLNVVILLSLFVNVFSQKEKEYPVNFKYHNFPNVYIPGGNYSIGWYIEKNSIEAKLKGFYEQYEIKGYTKSKTPDFLVFFEIDSLFVKQYIEEDKSPMNNMITYSNAMKLSVNFKIDVYDKHNIIIDYKTIPREKMTIKLNGPMNSDKSLIEKNKKSEIEELRKKCENKLVEKVKKLSEEYIDKKIANYIGDYTINLYSFESKKMDYTDIEKAIEQLKLAINSINTDNNKISDIDNFNKALSVLENEVNNYDEKNKKGRFDKKNFGYLGINTAWAYLIDDDIEKCEKCIGLIKSAKVRQKELRDIEEWLEDKKNQKSKEELSKGYETIKNKENFLENSNAFLFAILNLDLTEKYGNAAIILNKFHNSNFLLKVSEQVFTYGASAKETLKCTYNKPGVLDKAHYVVRGGVGDDYNINMDFNNKNGYISSVAYNGHTKYTVERDENNKCKSITRYLNEQPQSEWKFIYADANTVNIELYFYMNGQKKKSAYKYYLKLNENGLISDLYLDIYKYKDAHYNKLSMSESMSAYNPNSDNWITINNIYENDGINWISWTIKNFITVNRNLTYF